MPQNYEIWLGLVNILVYYVRQTPEIYQILPYWVWSFEIHWVRQYLVNVVLLGIKDMYTFDMTVKLKRNLCVGPVNSFPFLHC